MTLLISDLDSNFSFLGNLSINGQELDFNSALIEVFLSLSQLIYCKIIIMQKIKITKFILNIFSVEFKTKNRIYYLFDIIIKINASRLSKNNKHFLGKNIKRFND